MMPMRERYEHDPMFRTIVDTLTACIERGQLTPTETREAAMLAQILYENRNPRPVCFTMEDLMRGKV